MIYICIIITKPEIYRANLVHSNFLKIVLNEKEYLVSKKSKFSFLLAVERKICLRVFIKTENQTMALKSALYVELQMLRSTHYYLLRAVLALRKTAFQSLKKFHSNCLRYLKELLDFQNCSKKIILDPHKYQMLNFRCGAGDLEVYQELSSPKNSLNTKLTSTFVGFQLENIIFFIDFCTQNTNPIFKFLQHFRIFRNSCLKGLTTPFFGTVKSI